MFCEIVHKHGLTFGVWCCTRLKKLNDLCLYHVLLLCVLRMAITSQSSLSLSLSLSLSFSWSTQIWVDYLTSEYTFPEKKGNIRLRQGWKKVLEYFSLVLDIKRYSFTCVAILGQILSRPYLYPGCMGLKRPREREREREKWSQRNSCHIDQDLIR